MYTRRRFLGSLVAAAGGLNAGCVGFGQPHFENQCDEGSLTTGEVDVSSVSGAWPQYRFGPSNMGLNPTGLGVPDRAGIAWRYATCDPMWTAFPTVAEGTVYVSNSQRPSVHAFDAVTGEIQWTVEDGGSETAPAVEDGTVYVAGSTLMALDASDGTERWRADETDGQFPTNASPTVVDGVVYIGGGRNPVLNAFDADQGTLIWQVSVGGEDLSRSVPAVANGTVYVVDDEGTLSALDAGSGDQKWTAPAARSQASPVAANGRVYVPTVDERLLSIRHDGGVDWEASVPRSSGPPAVTSDSAYVTAGNELIAVSVEDGSIEWIRRFEQSLGRPVAANGAVYVGQRGYHDDGPKGGLLAVDTATGQRLWRLTTRGIPAGEGGPYAGTLGGPAVVDGALYACTGAGDVLAIGPA